MCEDMTKRATVKLARAYEFVAEFPDVPDAPGILFDEPEPLGDSRGPNATDVLAAAVGNCLSASLTFCLRKSRLNLERLTTNVTAHLERNEQGRTRIESIDVEMLPEVRSSDKERFSRCAAQFENFCTVTASVRRGIPVSVRLKDPVETPETCATGARPPR